MQKRKRFLPFYVRIIAAAGTFIPVAPFSRPGRHRPPASCFRLPNRKALDRSNRSRIPWDTPTTAAAAAATAKLKQPRTPRGMALLCQLLGMNCAMPTDFTFSFKGFSRRGGGTDIHSDGWGLAFYEGRGLRCFHDPEPCADSLIARFVSDNPLRTHNMIAHIRYATAGKTCLENVHPFQREMWGINWCFAHNGDAPLFKGKRGYLPWIGDTIGERIYNPVGDTDSEAIFCSILNALKAKFDVLPSLPVLYVTLQQLCQEIAESDEGTILNFLLGCGQHVQFAYSLPGARPGSEVWNGLFYTVREPPFTTAHLSDYDYSFNFSEVNKDDDRIAVIATKPLTKNEEWVEIGNRELILFDNGLPYTEANDCFSVELQGHGLLSDVIPPDPTLEEDLRRFQKRDTFFVGAGI